MHNRNAQHHHNANLDIHSDLCVRSPTIGQNPVFLRVTIISYHDISTQCNTV